MVVPFLTFLWFHGFVDIGREQLNGWYRTFESAMAVS